MEERRWSLDEQGAAWEGGIQVHSGTPAQEQKIRKGPEAKAGQGLETMEIQQNSGQPSES